MTANGTVADMTGAGMQHVDHEPDGDGPVAADERIHLIVLFGGAFILYTAMKEVLHMMALEDSHADDDTNTWKRPTAASMDRIK